MSNDKNFEKPKITVKIDHGDMVTEKELAVEKWEDIAACGTILTPASDVILCDVRIQFSDDVKKLRDDD
ncbi:hypothetical protein [uncultured Gemmobacter sp.]|uniref:hypothetical protein n=1 Tax=uncultured Gemmobacter sp. TaxID=1095917 RepID=UPI000A42DE81|nr:hypothetical protein [uncultured Gemmobacter sp.]